MKIVNNLEESDEFFRSNDFKGSSNGWVGVVFSLTEKPSYPALVFAWDNPKTNGKWGIRFPLSEMIDMMSTEEVFNHKPEVYDFCLDKILMKTKDLLQKHLGLTNKAS